MLMSLSSKFLRLLLQAEYFVLLRMRQVNLAPRTLVVVVTDVDVDEETKKNLGCLKFKLSEIKTYLNIFDVLSNLKR